MAADHFSLRRDAPRCTWRIQTEVQQLEHLLRLRRFFMMIFLYIRKPAALVQRQQNSTEPKGKTSRTPASPNARTPM